MSRFDAKRINVPWCFQGPVASQILQLILFLMFSIPATTCHVDCMAFTRAFSTTSSSLCWLSFCSALGPFSLFTEFAWILLWFELRRPAILSRKLMITRQERKLCQRIRTLPSSQLHWRGYFDTWLVTCIKVHFVCWPAAIPLWDIESFRPKFSLVDGLVVLCFSCFYVVLWCSMCHSIYIP